MSKKKHDKAEPVEPPAPPWRLKDVTTSYESGFAALAGSAMIEVTFSCARSRFDERAIIRGLDALNGETK